MSRPLTASDRRALIKLASSLPKGSEERKAILAGLGKTAMRPGKIQALGDSARMRAERLQRFSKEDWGKYSKSLERLGLLLEQLSGVSDAGPEVLRQHAKDAEKEIASLQSSRLLEVAEAMTEAIELTESDFPAIEKLLKNYL